MLRGAGLILTLVALGACVPASRPPAPFTPRVSAPPPDRPATTPVAAPPARPVAPPQSTLDWTQARLSPGGWSYRGSGSGASASFFGPAGSPQLTLRCEPGLRVTLARSGAAGGALTFRTSSISRTISADASGQAMLPAGDPLFDALAFSRGRFSVEASGAPQLIVPAWPELARVVDDCRR